MKILIVGDSIDPRLYDFFRRSRFPEDIRLILSVGDLPGWYLSYLMTVFNVRLYYVRGNHNDEYAENPPEGGQNIDGRIVTAYGLNIMGFEGSMHYFARNAVQYTERQMWWKWQHMKPRIAVKRRIDIILTHAPPYGIHDADDRCHTGFRCFTKMIHRYRPRYFIHGHTHLSYDVKQKRIDQVACTTVINGDGYYVLDVEQPR